MTIDFTKVSEIQMNGKHISAVWKNNKLLWSNDKNSSLTIIRTAGAQTIAINLITQSDPEKLVTIDFGDQL